jgi:hypothetical protein
MTGKQVASSRAGRGLAALVVVQIALLQFVPSAAAELITLAPDSIQNGSLYYNYYGNGNSGSGYNPLSSTNLKASNSYSTLATHSYSTYYVFAVDFDLSQIAVGSLVKSATLSVDEAITSYTAKLRLYSTTGAMGFSTFGGTPFSDRTIATQAATPTSFDLTSRVQNAINSGAGHLAIAAKNSGGGYSSGLFHFWISSVATWSNPQLTIVVPEPSTWGMLLCGAGLLLVAAMMGNRQRRRALSLAG